MNANILFLGVLATYNEEIRIPRLPGVLEFRSCQMHGCIEDGTMYTALMHSDDIGGFKDVVALVCQKHSLMAATNKLIRGINETVHQARARR